MNQFLKNAIKYVFAFGIAGFLIWWSLHGLSVQDKFDIKDALLRANYIYIIPVYIFLLLSHWFRCLRWQQIIEPMGYKPPIIVLLCGLFIGYTANQLIPRAGELVRCTIVARQQKMPVAKLIGTVITERSLDLVTLVILSFIAFFTEFQQIHDFAVEILNGFKANLKNGITAQHIIIAMLVVAAITLLIYFLKKKKPQWGKSIIGIFAGIWAGLISIGKIKNLFLFIVYTVLIWTGYIAATWIGCLAMPQTAHLQLGTALVLLISGTFGIIVAPGGLGAYPYAIQKALSFYGINKNIALAFGWMLWLVQFLFTIIFGVAAFIVLNEINKKHEKHSLGTAENNE